MKAAVLVLVCGVLAVLYGESSATLSECTAACPTGTYQWTQTQVDEYINITVANVPAGVSAYKISVFENKVVKLLQRQSGGSGLYCAGRKEYRRLTSLVKMLLRGSAGTRRMLAEVGLNGTTTRGTSTTLCSTGGQGPCCDKLWNPDDVSSSTVQTNHMANLLHTGQCRVTSGNWCADNIAAYNIPSGTYDCACARRACYTETLRGTTNEACSDIDFDSVFFPNCDGDVTYHVTSFESYCGSTVAGLCST
mmetsp:Transcript_8269/g.17799  ORF Transcript_8269/g.17799 Transcript_8269/m.17799 type:complete len:250 (-) Transcript_8269:108-857(-)